MWETRPVQLNVQLPRDVAAQLEEVAEADPDFVSRMVLYGLTRRSIYHQLRDNGQATETPSFSEGDSAVL